MNSLNKKIQDILQNIADALNEKFRDQNGDIDSPDSFYNYVTDVLDTEYRVDKQHRLRSVELCIALGGPNIYIDTADNCIKLFWGGETAEHWISTEISEEINEIYENLYFDGYGYAPGLYA